MSRNITPSISPSFVIGEMFTVAMGKKTSRTTSVSLVRGIIVKPNTPYPAKEPLPPPPPKLALLHGVSPRLLERSPEHTLPVGSMKFIALFRTYAYALWDWRLPTERPRGSVERKRARRGE